jgi:Fic family protein
MKIENYTAAEFGQPSSDPYQKWPYGYFLPKPVTDFTLHLDEEVIFAVARAESALGKVGGLAQLISNPEVLLAPSLMREALSSSRIEGTQASLTDVFAAERQSGTNLDDNHAEVLNYLNAMRQGASMLHDLPLSSRLVKAAHSTLMKGVRGEEKYPGEFRKSPVWIGSSGEGPDSSRFIPPLPEHIPDLFGDLETYMNGSNRHTAVLKAALAHYQFETIHPFLDGNGRIGRLLISLVFIHEGVLQQPVVNLSSYFEDSRLEYYDRLQAVREVGALNEWIGFFAKGVERQANESRKRIIALLDIQQRYRAQVATSRSSIGGIIDLLFQNPILDNQTVCRELGVSKTTAAKFLETGQDMGWLVPLARGGRGGKLHWYAREIWSATTTEDIGLHY